MIPIDTADIEPLLPWLIGFGAAVFALYGYDVVISLAGFFPLRRPPVSPATRRFAILICAHNEQSVIRGVIESLLAQDYPRQLYDIFVVADNCQDDTATVAKKAGAIVFERHNTQQQTKGYALQWGIERVVERGPYSALCVFDADNIMDSDFLRTMNDELASGQVAIQAYLDSKNPFDTWVTRAIALAYFVSNRFWLRPRNVVGISATLGGTGFCLHWDVLTRYGWDPGSLADDLDLTMRLIDDNIKVRYCYHTRTYDEKPLSFSLALRQRARWLQGHNDVALRWSWRMLKSSIWGLSLTRFDALLHLLQPVRLLLAFHILLLLGAARLLWSDSVILQKSFLLSLPGWGALLLFFVIYPVLILLIEKAPVRLFLYLLPFFLFGFVWIPAATWGLLRVRHRVWLHTNHVAAKSLPVHRNSDSTPDSTK